MKPILVAFFLLGAVVSSHAQENSTTKTATEIKKETVSGDLRCERYMTRDLSVLKEKLKEHCNLNKPFSASLSVFAGDDTYLYCCHGK